MANLPAVPEGCYPVKRNTKLAVLLFAIYAVLAHWPRPLRVSIRADVAELDFATTDFLAEINQLGLRRAPSDDNLAAGLYEVIIPSHWWNDPAYSLQTDMADENHTVTNPYRTATLTGLGIENTDRAKRVDALQSKELDEIQRLCERNHFFPYYFSVRPNGDMWGAENDLSREGVPIAKAYLARVHRSLAEGRLVDARRDVLTVFRLGRHFSQAYFDAEALVGAKAVHAVACQAATAWLSHPDITADDLREFRRRLAEIPPPRIPVITSDIGGRFFMLDFFRETQRRGLAYSRQTVGSRSRRFFSETLFPNLFLCLVDWNEVVRLMNARWDKWVEIVRIEDATLRRARIEEFGRELSGEIERMRSPGNEDMFQSTASIERSLSMTLWPASTSFAKAFQRAHMSRESVETCIAIKKFQLDTGEFPESLNVLLGGYLETIPKDVDVDEPLRYLRMKNGVLLYGVGHSKTDHGGRNDNGRDDQIFLIGSDDRPDP
ncbi:MAG: hypothetical protein CMJ70_02285 [Planctomycetaceae bacterium]|nr:hypothetical protein [Planctomycetaceae bacterium]